jgi:HNH endonuclease
MSTVSLRLTPSEAERFWSKVGECNRWPWFCWEWQAGCFDNGYGAFWLRRKLWKAHRVAWLIQFGEIPDDLKVLHKCDNPRCVRPSHLFLGTDADNMHDRDRKGRHGWSKRARCAYGHEYTPQNTVWVRGHRLCRKCRGRRNKAWRTAHPSYRRPLIVCSECGRERPHKARGKCGACIERERRHRAA